MMWCGIVGRLVKYTFVHIMCIHAHVGCYIYPYLLDFNLSIKKCLFLTCYLSSPSITLSVVTVGFAPQNYTVSEEGGSVNLVVMLLQGTLERDISVPFFTSSGTATETGTRVQAYIFPI